MSAPVKKVPIHLQSSQNRLLIKNGKIVNDDDMFDADIFIEDGVIKEIGRNLIIPGGTRTIDAAGKMIIPGGIDPHTHLELEMMGAKTVDDFYHGTKAAIAGGTTMIIDFVLPNKGQSLVEAYNRWRKMADEKVCCDYGLHVGVTWFSDTVRKEMEQLCGEEYGVNSFKMFMAYKDAWMLDDYNLCKAFEACANIGAVPQVHAENGNIIARNTEKLLAAGIKSPEGHELSREEEVEAEAVNRACVIANQTNSPLYIVHMMSSSAVDALNIAKKRGQKRPVFGETLAATLGTDGTHAKNSCFRHAAGHIMSPPLRSDINTPIVMMQALARGDLNLTGSDNCTFSEQSKELGKNDFSKIPNGVNGVEDRMSVVWERGVKRGIMDPKRFVAVTSTIAAKIFNIYPQKGRIQENSDADIVIWDPQATRTISAKTHHQNVDFNIFEGQVVHGVPQYVIVNGRVCVDDGQLRVVEGHGRFIKTPPFSPFVYKVSNGDTTQQPNEETHHLMEDDHFVSNGISVPNTMHIPVRDFDEMSVGRSSCSTPTGRKMRELGQRNLQDSTFSISEELEGVDKRTSVRVRNPPGGKSSGLW